MEDSKEIISNENVISSPELNNQNISLDIVTEGKATVRLSNDDKTFSAFYNPAQVR